MTTPSKTRGNQFPKGTSGNPAGRPRGSRHRVTVLAEKLLAQDAGEIVAAVVTAAKAGDLSAARIVLDRIVPPVKERPICIDLPISNTPQGIAEAQGAIVEAVAWGELLPGEGAALSGLLESRRKAIETADHAARIELIERALKINKDLK